MATTNYTRNALNQYLSRDVPGAVDILGVAFPAATVTVNGNSTYRKGEYYQKALTIGNSGSAVYQAVTITANNGTASSSTSGNVFVPRTPENFDDPATSGVINGPLRTIDTNPARR